MRSFSQALLGLTLFALAVSGQDTRGNISCTVTDAQQWNGNIMRSFKITEGVRLELRGDAMNLQNRSQMSAPDLSPTSTNFGRVTSQTSSLNRFYQVQVRVRF